MMRLVWMTRIAALTATVAFADLAHAGFVVIANHTDRDLTFTLLHPGGKPRAERLTMGDGRIFPVGREPEIEFDSGGRSLRFRLDPYHAYAFTASRTEVAIRGVELAGVMPKPDDVPAEPPSVAPLLLKLRVMVDDADPRAQAAWEKALRERVAAASAILERQTGIALDVAAVGEWASDPTAEDVPALLKDFERKVPADPRLKAIGFSSRPVGLRKEGDPMSCSLGVSRGPLHTHVVIREAGLRTEPERVEVLVHELAHLVGAAHAPDHLSAMRPKLGDGQARSTRFRITLDPLNLLAIGIWAEELRTGKVVSWRDLRPVTRERLTVVYKTIAHVFPDDSASTDYLVILDRLEAPKAAPGGVARVPVPAQPPVQAPVPAPPQTEPALTPREEAIRKVVRAVAVRAGDLNRLPASNRPRGDQLTEEYVRAAAAVAVTQDEALQVPAFLIGLGIGLDDSSLLRDNPLTRQLCRTVESDADRRERIAALGLPTMRHRRDLCQHFAVSAALTELMGAGAAEAAGLAKEVLDMQGVSGFSFADLAADFAGITFAQKLQANPRLLMSLKERFTVTDHVPSVVGLREGLSRRRFEQDFGSQSDKRFTAALEEVRKRIADLPGHRK